ncbi:NUDIX hydrolase [Paenibacillus sp. CAA11]|uniref:NUDIX hydrolase n=1 Tax=Paenibacillus sp. CAA11 TaxID=1532905 RepID=UPI000D37E3E9|nr:NUDIX domain-containing protein [Paenibacillus sp. CAA11]AWB43648.1 NUDIX hydrolase [Paenibacillus sp. CAA11]
MIGKIIRRLPRPWLVKLYQFVPFQRFKDWAACRAQAKFRLSVLGIITNRDGEVLLLKHVYRDEPWRIPGGWIDSEAPELAFRREIREETGFEVEYPELVKALYYSKPDRVELIYRAAVASGSFQSNEEISEMQFCSVGDWPEGMPEDQKRLIQSIFHHDDELTRKPRILPYEQD